MSPRLSATHLGFVRQVQGATISVEQVESVASGTAIIEGRAYRIGQVGAFVRIPQGYQDLLGVISQVGASPLSGPEADAGLQSGRWVIVQLVGESLGNEFERGISQHPSVGDEVHLVTEKDLKIIYGGGDLGQIVVGRLASAEAIPARVDLEKMITRHSAVLGSTGSGKSTTVASLLRSIVEPHLGGIPNPSARILLLDIHGEYAPALGDIAQVFRINARDDESELYIPYWALSFDELFDFVAGGIPEEKEMHLADKVVELKGAGFHKYARPGVERGSITVDTPLPFSLKQLWYELIEQEVMTFEGPNRDQPALEASGDPNALIAPTYRPWRAGAQVVLNPVAPGIRRQLDQIRSALLDRRFDFLLHPGPWEPELDCKVEKDLGELLHGWLGHGRPVTILDLSGIPSNVLTRLISSLLRIVYDALFWSRDKSEGGVNRPLLIVMEEAHAYLDSSSGDSASRIVRRIAKEGRKYGVGAMIVSQRPSEVDESILSQCGTFFALRLSNPNDRSRVIGTLPDHLVGLIDSLPVLRTGEAIVLGEAARLPMRVRMLLPPDGRRPESEDPDVSERWRIERIPEDYDQVVAAWRAQSPRAVKNSVKIERTPILDD